MKAKILDGRWAAGELRRELGARVAKLRSSGVAPRLCMIRVGEDPASIVYVRNKAKASAEVGIDSDIVALPDDAPPAAIAEAIDLKVSDPGTHGILLQLPLPRGLDPVPLLGRIDPAKDVDGFHPINVGRLCLGADGFVPCTPLGILELLRRHGIDLAGRHVAVVGRSTTVGRPLANLLSRKDKGCDATVTMLHTGSREPRLIARTAEILIAAAGRRGLIDETWVRPGAIVVDVGIHRTEDGRLVGDVDASSVGEIASWLSPVPGGVGPMTVACLMANAVRAAELQGGAEA